MHLEKGHGDMRWFESRGNQTPLEIKAESDIKKTFLESRCISIT